MILYGIPNCDTVKKAKVWLEAQGLGYQFHDYKKAGITAAKLNHWCDTAGWDVILNRAGTTFKKLPDDAKAGLDQPKAIALMIEQPSMIKRPIVEQGANVLVGFKPAEWEARLL